MAQHLELLVTQTPKLELMNEVTLNIVPFRFNPGDLDNADLDRLNERLGEAVLADGRFLVGTSKIGPRTVFRPAFSNWRTRRQDVNEFVEVLLEVAARLD